MLEGIPFAPAGRLAQFARMIEAFERDEIERAVDSLIDMLDRRDGDADLEPNGDQEGPGGFAAFAPHEPDQRRAEYRDAEIALATEDDEASGDELDGNGSEDDFMHHYGSGPGCPIADIDKGDDEDGDRASWAEWHTLPASQRCAGLIDGKPLNPLAAGIREDDEDDDADTSVEDDPSGFDPEEDRCSGGDDGVFSGGVIRYAFGSEYEPGSEDDAEEQQMIHDVPTLAVHSRDYEPFTERRRFLGYSNLLTSFVSGSALRSADTGGMTNPAIRAKQPGVPV